MRGMAKPSHIIPKGDYAWLRRVAKRQNKVGCVGSAMLRRRSRSRQGMAQSSERGNRRKKRCQSVAMHDVIFTISFSENGVSPSGTAAGFDPAIRRFESFSPRAVRLLWLLRLRPCFGKALSLCASSAKRKVRTGRLCSFAKPGSLA